jgi:tyrosyl-tRNA synthetase
LLEGLDGVQKMSKSLDNYIGIDERPEVMYRKAMSIPDNLITRYWQLVTDIPPDQLAAEERALREGENPRNVKRRLAERLVQQFHPSAAPFDYRGESGEFVTSGPQTREVAPGERSIAQLFFDAGLVSSKSEARRLGGQKGITVNGLAIDSAEDRITPTDGMILQRGLHRVVRLKVKLA